MKVSIVTWDASFRESLHTIDSFGPQTSDTVEFIWVDYYNVNKRVKKKLSKFEYCHFLNLDFEKNVPWHLGKCINAGIKEASGDILIIPDGDIVVSNDFVSKVCMEMGEAEDKVVYFRRYDELAADMSQDDDIVSLENRCVLTNPTNYAGCLVLHRNLFDRINGFEEHWAFAGPGINGKETNIRLQNSGALIRWSEDKIYHPWHNSTGRSASSDEEKRELANLMLNYHWLLPYAGMLQSWIVRQRALQLSTRASTDECDSLFSSLPQKLKIYVKDKL
jgi:glycosyltransferase involved in cell wall biosynthesis